MLLKTCITRKWAQRETGSQGRPLRSLFLERTPRTWISDGAFFSRYNLGRCFKGSLVLQKKVKNRLNVQFPRLDALLVLVVIRVNMERKKLTSGELILYKWVQALLLVLTHLAPNYLLRRLKFSTFHRAEV